VYLEEQDRLEAYLARLHNLAGDRPLVMAEIGLDSRSNGEAAQAEVLRWQVGTAFGAGCAGAFLFAWTDEWYITHLDESGEGQGGSEIEDWDFGLVDRDRRAKPALLAVREAFAAAPLRPLSEQPRISVVVCTYNGARTLRETMQGLARLDYPDFDVIVVDDGSVDESAAIARAHGARVISTENRGLSAARNTGLAAATGEIVAYLDDDAYPDRHWLTYLADAYRIGDYVGVGGPNIAPGDERGTAAGIGFAPGSPTHVLISDREAEHIPGCNCSFRTDALAAVGGFDTQFRVAGDDVDLCWRMREAGGRIGFSPPAMVWHHRRASLRTYWRQQRGYGKAEALLERKWPEKYNSAGHPTWGGRIYGNGLVSSVFRRQRVYHGMWGSALFQSLYEREPGVRGSLPAMPEWYLVIACLAALSALGSAWTPLLAALPVLVLAAGASIVQAATSAVRATAFEVPAGRVERLRLRATVALLFLVQPLARLLGRLGHGLTPWRWGELGPVAFPAVRRRALWSERWCSPEDRLRTLEAKLRQMGGAVVRGGDFDRWDLTVRCGALSCVRVRTAVEEHGAGRQLVRVLLTPRPSSTPLVLALVTLALGLVAALDGAALAAAVLCIAGVALAAATVAQAAAHTGHVLATLDEQLLDEAPEPETSEAAPVGG
ncbi:MAG: glycosyltransferase, partial [Thermoleophilaceae bacterium]|nr:glycosyltransferase [Thermoleophilaceae bacterium]